MPEGTVVIFGAGRIGRGFAGDLFAAAGYRLTFVDAAEALVAQMRAAGRYTVVHARGAGDRTDRVISGFTALSTAEAEAVAAAVAGADLLAVAVFPRDFPAVAGQLVAGLARRRRERPGAPLDIVLCCNLAHAGPAFSAALAAALPDDLRAYASERVGVVETLVIRMVAEPPAAELARDPLLVWTNGYGEFPVDAHAWRGAIPDVAAFRPVEDMRAEEMRKLYTYNTFHAALAYHGALRGIERVVDCLADAAVSAAAEGALAEAAAALRAEYGFDEAEMARWCAGVRAQTDNATLGDTVRRFGADPRRKLARADRLIGPLALAWRHGLAAPHLLAAAGAALCYAPEGDEGGRFIQEQIERLGVREAVRALGEFTAEEDALVDGIAAAYEREQAAAEWRAKVEAARALGFEYERTFKGCGQCTVAVLLETLGRFDDGVFEAATAFAGGLGHAGDSTCGALIGASMVTSLLYPRRRAQFDGDRENKYCAFSLAQKLRERFVETYGGIRCQDVHCALFGQAYDLRDAARRDAFEAAGAHVDKCTNVVGQAAAWAMEIIAEEDLRRRFGDGS